MRHRTAGRARFASAASAAQDGGSSRNGATRVHPIGVPAAHSAAGNGTMFPRKPLLFGRGILARSTTGQPTLGTLPGGAGEAASLVPKLPRSWERAERHRALTGIISAARIPASRPSSKGRRGPPLRRGEGPRTGPPPKEKPWRVRGTPAPRVRRNPQGFPCVGRPRESNPWGPRKTGCFVGYYPGGFWRLLAGQKSRPRPRPRREPPRIRAE